MASIYFEVTYTDDRKEVVRVGPKAQVLYERHFGTSFWSFGEERRVEQMYFMAWQALECAGKTPAPFDDFLEQVEDVTSKRDTPDDPADDDAVNPEVDPTQKAQQPETSLS